MINKMYGYEADAEILGSIRHVVVDEHSIEIFGFDGLDEAGRVLEALSRGTIAAVRTVAGMPIPGGATTPGSNERPESEKPNGVLPPAVQATGEPVPKQEPKEGDVPEAIKTAGKLRDVVAWLLERGVKDEAAVLAELRRIAPQVPVVSLVSNLPDRVKRTMAALAADD